MSTKTTKKTSAKTTTAFKFAKGAFYLDRLERSVRKKAMRTIRDQL